MGNWAFTGQVNLFTGLSKRFLNANSGSPCVPLHRPWDHCRHLILLHTASGASLGLSAFLDASSATHWQDHTWILPWSRGFHLWNSITHPRPQHHPTWLTVLLPSVHALFLSSSSSAYLLPCTCAPSGARFCILSGFSHVQVFATLWTAALWVFQARLQMPCPPPGDLPDPGIEPTCLRSTCILSWVLYC